MAPPKVYSITEWSENYENHETRKRKTLFWVLVPNGHDSLGFCEIMENPNGMEIFGAWILILQVASRCQTRGILTNNRGKPYTAQDIAKKTRSDPLKIAAAMKTLVAVGWISADEAGESADTPASHADTPASVGKVDAATSGTKKERKRREENLSPSPSGFPQETNEEGGEEIPSGYSPEFVKVWRQWERYHAEQGRPLIGERRQAQLAELGTMGEAAAIKSVLHAIMRGWQSPAKANQGPKAKPESIDQDSKRELTQSLDRAETATAAALESMRGAS